MGFTLSQTLTSAELVGVIIGAFLNRTYRIATRATADNSEDDEDIDVLVFSLWCFKCRNR